MWNTESNHLKLKNQFCIPADWIKTLDPRVKERIRIDTRADMETKGKIERAKKEADLDKKIKTKKATEADKQMEFRNKNCKYKSKWRNDVSSRTKAMYKML